MPQAQCSDSTTPAFNIINVCIVYSIRWREKFSQLKNNLARVKKKKKKTRSTETSTNKTGTCLTKFFCSPRKQYVYSTRAMCLLFRQLKWRTTRRQRRRKQRRRSRHQPAKLCTAKRKNKISTLSMVSWCLRRQYEYVRMEYI